MTQHGSSLEFKLYKGRKRVSPEKEESHKGRGFSCVPPPMIRESLQKKRCFDQCPGEEGSVCDLVMCFLSVVLCACSSHLGPDFACWSIVKQDVGSGMEEEG